MYDTVVWQNIVAALVEPCISPLRHAVMQHFKTVRQHLTYKLYEKQQNMQQRIKPGVQPASSSYNKTQVPQPN